MLRASWRLATPTVLLFAYVLAGPPPFEQGAGAQSVSMPATIVFAHINDVYEIDASENGATGGLARVATVFDRLRRAGSPVLTTLGGDFLSPSAIGFARVNGEPIAGRQMVEVLNAIGLQWATLGNHEFDLPQPAFLARLAEAKFTTVVANVTDVNGALFPGTVRSAVATIRASGRTVRVGFIGLVTNFNQKPWVRYQPPIEAARTEVAALRGKVDAIVALTHLPLDEDQALLEALPDIDLTLGGHDHENWYLRRGDAFAPIVKADANARSVAVATMRIVKNTRPEVSVRFESLDKRVAPQARTQALVQRWMDTGMQAYAQDGLAPAAVVADVPIALDGRESTIRRRSGVLTTLIAEALRRETHADIGILNAGTVRIDDVLRPGPIRQYDVIRILPFGGKVMKATIDGALLVRLLDTGLQNVGIGGYLHPVGVTREGAAWVANGKPIDPAGRYSIGVPEFLLTGGESRMDFLSSGNPQVTGVQAFRDIRLPVIDELRLRFGRASGLLDDGLQWITSPARK